MSKTGRPRVSHPKFSFTVRMEDELIDIVKNRAVMEGIPASEIIRNAVLQYLGIPCVFHELDSEFAHKANEFVCPKCGGEVYYDAHENEEMYSTYRYECVKCHYSLWYHDNYTSEVGFHAAWDSGLFDSGNEVFLPLSNEPFKQAHKGDSLEEIIREAAMDARLEHERRESIKKCKDF